MRAVVMLVGSYLHCLWLDHTVTAAAAVDDVVFLHVFLFMPSRAKHLLYSCYVLYLYVCLCVCVSVCV